MDRIKHLLLQFLREQSTPAEQAELEAWLNADPANRELLDELQDSETVTQAMIDLGQPDRQAHWNKVQQTAERLRPELPHIHGLEELVERKPLRRMSWLAAACIAGALLAGCYWALTRWNGHEQPPIATAPASTHDALPCTDKAILTLAGGRQLVLGSANQDTVLTEGVAVVASAKGKLAYNTGNHADAAEVAFNTLTTPRGGQYQLTLPDGTHVWLNAASSITYPTAFTGNDRTVTITGEAYLEVARSTQPFIAQIGERRITVLGTSFNVNAYPDETAMKTTLIEGKIRVSDAKQQVTLNPGQQAQATGTQIAVAQNADLDQALAWKNGLFSFTKADLPTVMRQLARW